MKTKYFTGLLLLTLSTFFSCKKELEPQESSSAIISTTDNSKSNSAVPSAGLPTNSTSNSSLPKQEVNVAAVSMNPPHGQVGHRCDIAVGTPLNSAPNKSNKTAANSASDVALGTIVKPKARSVVAKPGINPPHGQAGHRCDIAVGASLKSQPNKSVPIPAVSDSAANTVPPIFKFDSTTTAPK